jgi:putative membrane protein
VKNNLLGYNWKKNLYKGVIRKMKINLEFKFVISLLFAVMVAIFAIQNSAVVEISFLFAKFSISQAVVILISALAGAFIVLLLSLVKQIGQNKVIKQLKLDIKALEEERDNLYGKLDEQPLDMEEGEGKVGEGEEAPQKEL